MERLTRKYPNGTVTIKEDLFVQTQGTIDREIRNSEPIRAAVERLALYEDLEEEKNLIVLPLLKHKQSLYFIYEGKIKEVYFSSYQIKPEFDNLIQIHAHKNGFNACFTVEDIGKTVFLSRKEAEQALKERNT